MTNHGARRQSIGIVLPWIKRKNSTLLYWEEKRRLKHIYVLHSMQALCLFNNMIL